MSFPSGCMKIFLWLVFSSLKWYVTVWSFCLYSWVLLKSLGSGDLVLSDLENISAIISSNFFLPLIFGPPTTHILHCFPMSHGLLSLRVWERFFFFLSLSFASIWIISISVSSSLWIFHLKSSNLLFIPSS